MVYEFVQLVNAFHVQYDYGRPLHCLVNCWLLLPLQSVRLPKLPCQLFRIFIIICHGLSWNIMIRICLQLQLQHYYPIEHLFCCLSKFHLTQPTSYFTWFDWHQLEMNAIIQGKFKRIISLNVNAQFSLWISFARHCTLLIVSACGFYPSK